MRQRLDRTARSARARVRSVELPKPRRDLAVVCFDDVEYSRLYPFLTVMSQPAESYGAIATQLLLDRLNGHIGQRRRLVVLPSDLIVRESSGAPIAEPAKTG